MRWHLNLGGYKMDLISEDNLPKGIGVNNLDVETNLKNMIIDLNKNYGYFLTRKDFQYCVTLDEHEIDPIKIKEWMRDNLDGNSITIWNGEEYKYNFYFVKDHDAMGFRLLWDF